jgi:Ca-activated chloride channel family protein
MSLVVLVGASGNSSGQQCSFASSPALAPKPVGSVLEVPSTSAGQNPNEPLHLPQLDGQAHQRLELPSNAPQRETGYEQLIVTVTDRSGRYVTGLQKNDFRIYVDNIQRPVQFLHHDFDTPASVGIVVDSSGSMRRKIPQARMAIERFVGALDPRDDIFLLEFSTRTFLLQPFTTSHSQLIGRLPLLRADADTALFDAIMTGLSIVGRGRNEKKALLIVTDGMDNASRTPLAQVVAEARRTGVLIYSVGIGDPNRGVLGIGAFIFSGDSVHVDAQTLRQLANETGARNYLLGEIGDGELLRQDCEEISNELREQYTLGFVAPDPLLPGYRGVRLDVPGRPELTTRLREGVTVGP